MHGSAIRTISLSLSWLFWACLLAVILATSAPGNRTIWAEWYTLLVEEGRDIEEVHRAITAEGGPTVLSFANAEALYQSFPELERVGVATLSDRFDPEDPRLDPYLEALPSFFSVAGGERRYHLLLLRQERSTQGMLRLLRSRLGGGLHRGWPATGDGWLLVDALSANSLLIGLLFLIWAGGLLFFFRSIWLPGLPLLLSFLPAVATGAPGTVAAGLLLFALLHLLKASRRELRLRTGRSYRRVMRALKVPELLPAGWSVLSVGVLLIAAGEGGGAALRVVGSFFLGMVAILLVLVTDFLRYTSYEHHPFTPTSILTRRFGAPKPKPGLPGTLWGSGGLLLVVIVSLFIPPVQAPSVPAPSGRVVEEEGYAALERLLLEAEGGLPNVASYVAHRAFQESITYGGSYRIPAKGEAVALPTYDVVDGRLEESREVVLRFDEGWLREVLSEGTAYPGLQTLLLSQGRFSGVEYASFDRLYLSNFQPAPLAGALLVAFSPFFMFGLTLARNLGVRSSKREA